MNGWLRGTLIFLDGFAAVSALFGGLELETGWPAQFPTSMLQGTPFSDYLIPGLLLGIVVGGSATVATAATIWSREAGAIWSFVAGSIMAGWIVGEVVILDALAANQAFSPYFWLQPFYFVVGMAMVLLALRLAPGGWRGLARRAHLA
jgi:hypothetical protein